jgi:hypothetical protein
VQIPARKPACGQIVAATAVAAGREVHNTYGELGNAELVAKYGFALPGNPFDAVRVDKAALVAAAIAELGPRACRARARFLALHRCPRTALTGRFCHAGGLFPGARLSMRG